MKIFKKTLKIIFKSILIILGVFILSIVVLNAFKHPYYIKYYNVKTDLAYNQGLGDDFVSQGVCKVTLGEKDYYLTSGYMSNGEPSRVYVNHDNNYYYVNIKLNDYKLSYDHLGGITCAKDKVYLTGEREIYEIPLDEIIKKPTKQTYSMDKVVLTARVSNAYSVDVDTSFVYADPTDTYLYVGEFNYGPYVTEHHHKVNGGNETYHAYVNCYNISKLGTDNALEHRFAIRDKVQGFAIADGKIVLSTSWSVPSSTVYVYNVPEAGNYDEDNIYFLDDRYLTKTIKAPAMMEALDYCPTTKQFITLFESASNKYIFGKFFLANKIVGLTL